MSGSYYKVTPEREKIDGYGFKKVSQSELSNIIERVTKATYSSRVLQDESEMLHNYRRIRSAHPPRTPSVCQRRRISASPQSCRFDNDQKLSEMDLQRVVRRVRRPTRAYRVSRQDYDVNEEGGETYNMQQDTITRSRRVTPSEKRKAFDQLSRPTTASRAKNVTDCHLCAPEDLENNNILVPFDYPYADDTMSATKEEVASIVSRISSPTKASEKGVRQCWRSPPNMNELRYMSDRLPLVSGLGRSKSVSHIVDRLHHTKGCYRKKYHGYSVQETATADFYNNTNTQQTRQ